MILGAAAGVAALAVLAAAATAGPPGRWTQITHAHNGAKSNLGLARGRDGTLHVVWAGPSRGPFTAIFDTPVSRAGVVGQQRAIVSGWDSVQPPAAAVAPDGSIHALVSGQKVLSTTDPNAGLNEAVGPGAWRLGARAFGRFEITVPSSADVGVAVLKSGQLVSVWRSAVSLLFQTSADPSVRPQDITPQGLAESPAIAVDQASGDAIVAYRHVASGDNVFRRALPSLGAPQVMPGSKAGAPSIAARAGGGVYSAYALDGTKVRLLRFGSQAKAVPVPKGVRVLTAGVAAGPEGRLWVFYGNEQTTYVTRTSKAVAGFEPVQALKSPPGTVQYLRLEGEGSGGPLDLFANVTIDGSTKDGSYHQQVQPALSVRASKELTKNKQGKVTGARVTIRVTDAGDAVSRARVTGLPGGAKATDASGSIVVTTRPGKTLALVATKPGYVGAKARLSL
ncbi:MAG: hypothetical protein ACRDPX_14570 [Gaiellaceae bacterium]